MQRLLPILSIVTAACLAPTSARAEPSPRHHAGVSVMGFAGFLRHNVGSFTGFYEHGLTDHHALRLAGDFLHVHHAADHIQSHQWTYGASIGYRYHLRPGGGLFLGVEVGYRRGRGHFGERDAPEHTMVESRQLRVLPEVGYRHVHPRLPLSFVTRLAAGYGPYTVTTARRDDVGTAAMSTSLDNLGATPIAVELELSIAYAF